MVERCGGIVGGLPEVLAQQGHFGNSIHEGPEEVGRRNVGEVEKPILAGRDVPGPPQPLSAVGPEARPYLTLFPGISPIV